MLDDTLARLQAEIAATGLEPEKRASLLRSLATLEKEIEAIRRTDAEQAKSIAAFAHLSAQEATRTKPQRELLELSLAGLRKSVTQFEQTHPRLVDAVASLATTLSGFGF
ncbi:MAG: DUF4404 family protein [Polyangiaceae bacterium]